MKKITISKLFLYRYRFIIGYVFLGIAFLILLFSMPLIAQHGISEAEMDSVVSSYQLTDTNIVANLVDLPYKVLQKLSITALGLTPYAIKLPSIIIGIFLGLLLILLLNRWFKSNVSLLASCIIVLSTPFLFLAGSGTPLIMLVFWPTLLLWLGSKIQGEKRPKPSYCFLFAIAMLGSIFTPYMLYFAVFCVLFVFAQPHLRFVVKSLPKLPLALVMLIVAGGIIAIIVNTISRPETIMELLFAKNYDISSFFSNMGVGLETAFLMRGTLKSTFLTPLLSLPIISLALVGLFSTTRGFFASRNSIASVLIVFGLILIGFNPDAIVFMILPISILVAHGLKYLLEKWYGLFPENPYARVAAILPLAVLFGIMIIPSLLQYMYGYRYNPEVATEFNYDLGVIHDNLNTETLVVTDKYDFYKILEDSTELSIVNSLDEVGKENFAILRGRDDKYQLSRIITSPMKDNSDIIYLYTGKGE